MHIGMRIRDMCFETSFLNKLGCVEDYRYQITGQCFNDMLSNLNSLQSKRFVCDATKGDHSQSSRTIDNFSQNSLSWTARHVRNDNPNELKIPSIPAITTEFSQEQMNEFVIDDPNKQMKEV